MFTRRLASLLQPPRPSRESRATGSETRRSGARWLAGAALTVGVGLAGLMGCGADETEPVARATEAVKAAVTGCRMLQPGEYLCDPGINVGSSCHPTKVYRSVMNCDGTVVAPESVIDLSTGYSNYTCASRFQEQCIDDGTYDSYYLERCEYSCTTPPPPLPYVGMVPKDLAKPCPYAAYLHFDDEDDHNNNQLWLQTTSYNGQNVSVGGFLRMSSPWKGGANTTISYCQEAISALPRTKIDYAVISGSSTCPANSYRFTRRLDNEDDGNHNSEGGEVDPNVASRSSDGYSFVNFCFVPADPSATDFLPSLWNDNYIFFTTSSAPLHGYLYTDDEDSSNNDQYSSSNATYTTRMQAIISAGSNTYFRFGWTGSTNPIVVKSASGSGCGTAPTPPSCSDLSVPTCNSQWTAYDIKAAQWDACTL
jgi:hypothetical protein